MGSSLVCLLLAFFRTFFFHNPSWLQSLKWKFSFTLYFLLVSSFLWFSCQPTSPTQPRAYKGFCPILLLTNMLTTAHAVKLYGKYLPRKKHWNIRLLLGNHQGAIREEEKQAIKGGLRGHFLQFAQLFLCSGCVFHYLGFCRLFPTYWMIFVL